MSIGVTVHDVVDLSAPMVSNPLADLDNVRKIANEKLRIRRLVQVRQQSKQLAAKVRQNYQQAKEKELAKIEQTKREEVKAWKRQHIRNLQDEYARNVCEVGEAHRAAEAAEECAVWFEEKRASQQAVALQRGRTAEANAARERDRKEAQKEAKLKKKQYVPSKSVAVQASIPVVEPPVAAVETRKDAIPLDTGSSTDPTPSPYEHFRSNRIRMNLHTVPETVLSDSDDEHCCPGKENVPGVPGVPGVHEYSATAFTSPSDFRPNVVSPSPPTKKPQRLQPFTQITELIQQRRRQQQHSLHDDTRPPAGAYREPYSTQKTVQFDDVSDNTLSFPTSSVLTSDDRPFVPLGANESPRKVPPRKMAEKARTVPTVQQAAGAKMGTIGNEGKRMKKSIPPESSSSTVSYADGAFSTKVQYYDCNTRFRKEYDQPVGFVQREQYRTDDPTGMEEANRYEQLQQELAKARSKPTVDRTKPALEKQQTRKDYEKLSKELDNLTRTENKLKGLAVPTKSTLSEATIKQQAVTRQRKANEAIESLLRQRSLVTCPVVQMQTEPRSHPSVAVRPSVVNVGEMKTQQQQPDGKDISTDSCASIVLDTFERPGIPLPPSDRHDEGTDKIAKLKDLLDQINEQRRLLTEEIAREKVEQAAKPMVDGKVNANTATKQEIKIARLEHMKRRQEELLEQQQLLQKREREVEELGRQLEEKMALLQRKQEKQQKEAKKAPRPKVHVETAGQKGAIDVDVVQASSSVGSSISETSKDSSQADDTQPPPVKIIITVNDKGTAVPAKSKHKKKATQEKKKSEIASQLPQATVAPEPTQTEIIKPLASRKEAALPKKRLIDFSPGSSSTTSTVYRPLPPKIGSLKILQREVVPGAAHEPGKPIASAEPAQKYNLQKSDKPKKMEQLPAGAANLNPNLLKYIVRLLGMSRKSIDQLGVSSTSISTPSASIVNVSSNVAGGQPGQPLAPNEEESERVHRLRKFIDENYNFLQEIDETLRRSSSDQSTLGSTGERSGLSVDADVSRVEGVWMETLRRRERTMKKQQKKAPTGTEDGQLPKKKAGKKKADKPQSVAHEPAPKSQPAVQAPAPVPSPPPVPPPPPPPAMPTVAKEGSLKSILKSPKRDTSAKVAKIITPQGHVEVINLSDREEQEILERYSQITERCSQRITELSQMINQVREEKRRLIEDSLSSLEQQESTKYMDLPPAISRTAGITVTQPQNAVAPLASPQPVGQSTAPSVVPPAIGDDPVSEEIDNIFSSKQIGLSKDSGIAMSRPLTASDIRESPSEEGSQGREPLPFEPFLKDIPKPPLVSSTGGQLEVGPKTSLRRSTPPVAIARFSPQLPDELPMHELSTIPEVETPAPPAKGNDLSAVSVTAGQDNSNTAGVLAEARNRLLLNEPTLPDIGYDRFPNYEEYVRSATTGTGTASFVRIGLEQTIETNEKSTLGLDVTEEREPDRLAYRKFPGQAPAFDITEEGEATVQQSSVGSSTPGHTVNKSGSDTSLPDVVAELRKLNIIVKPFNNSLDNSNRSTPLSDTPGATAKAQAQPPPRNPPEMQPLSESFQRDLENAGLKWASSMLKRSSQLEQHSSSGSSPNSMEAQVIGPNDETVPNDNDGGLGKPPKLNEFLARELMVRTHSDLQSVSSLSTSSHGSHSTLLRSLLNLSRLDNSHSNASPLLLHTPTDGKSIQRTSTPVASKSTASGNSFRLVGNGNTDPTITNNRTETEGLFSGESRLSSVHWSSSSGNSSDRQEPPRQERLTVPNVRLERQSSVSNREGK